MNEPGKTNKGYRKIDVGFLTEVTDSFIAMAASDANLILFESKSKRVEVRETDDDNLEYTILVWQNEDTYLRGFTFPFEADRVIIFLNDKEIDSTRESIQSLEFDHPILLQRNAEIRIVYKLDPKQFASGRVMLDLDTARLGYATIQFSLAARENGMAPDDLTMQQLEDLLHDFVCE